MQQNKLTTYLKAFYGLTNIRIVVFDENICEVASYPQRHAPFCQLVKANERTRRLCSASDACACLHCMRQGESYRYACFAGLQEAVTPIARGGVNIGYLMLGQIFTPQDRGRGWANIQSRLSECHADCDSLKAAFLAGDAVNAETVENATTVMEMFAHSIASTDLVDALLQSLPLRVKRYIYNHLSSDLDATSLCAGLNISRGALYRVFRDDFGASIPNYIRDARIRQAQKLLSSSDRRIHDIAVQVGIPDYNYFSKVFKRVSGCSPREYRQNVRDGRH